MEMESRRRELARKRRNRERQLRRRILAGGLVCGVLCLGVGVWAGGQWLERGPVDGDGSGAGDLVTVGRAESEAGEMTEGSGAENPGPDAAEIVSRETAVDGSQEKTVFFGCEDELPSRFDLREHGTAPMVPDQGTFGTCWAFASLGALESSMPEELRTNLSADHMSLRNSFGLGQNAGGDYSVSSAYLLGWQGPVAEVSDPYGDGYSPDGLEPVCHVQEIQVLKEKDYEAIKRAVYTTGGVQSSFYMPQTEGAERDRYYNEETQAFYYDGSLEANHDVVIVGWEDSYPKENFAIEPEEDGAFLCMNTWGESFGDRGYFYISYEDSRIGTANVTYTGIESADNYDQICQTDLCGWTGQLGYGSSKAWFANVYKAAEDSLLKAVGFYATVPETNYKVYVAACGEDERPFMTGTGENNAGVVKSGQSGSERILAAEGRFDNAGYYTVTLDGAAGKPGGAELKEAVKLAAGESFAVIVELDSPETTEPVAVEYAAGERTANVDVSDGEGYVSPDGEYWQRAEKELQCNVCLKAYLRYPETP